MNIEKNSEFHKELVNIINKFSIENYSDTPDFILANYLVDCLNAFNNSSNDRRNWYNSKNDRRNWYNSNIKDV